MRGITKQAGEQLSMLLTLANAEDNVCIRLVAPVGRNMLKMDTALPRDKVFKHKKRLVLTVDEQVAHACAGRTLDFRDNEFRVI